MNKYIIMRLMSCVVFTAAPSQALVDRVRDLYHKRVSDVRFLIPVLTGLSKVRISLSFAHLATCFLKN